MGLTGLVLLQKSKGGVYRSGEPVTGILKYTLDKPTNFTSINICLVGKGKCHWSETDSDDCTTYYGNKEDYVNTNKNVLAGRLYKKHLAGTYDYPFELFLPENIPTSFKNRTCTIEYKVIATFVKDNFFGTKHKFETELTVYGYVNPVSREPLIFSLKKELYILTSLEIKAEIEKTCLTPGESIKLNLSVNNDTDVPITIKTELMEYLTYISDGKTKKVDKDSVKTTSGYSPTIKAKSISKITCVVPTLRSLYSIQHSKVMITEYKLKLTAKLPFPHINASVKTPVVIGMRKGHLAATVVGFDAGSPSSSKTPAKYVTERAVGEYDGNWDFT